MDKPVSLVERLSKCCPCRGRVFSKCRAEAYCPCSDADKLGAVGKKNTVACLWSGHALEAEAKELERMVVESARVGEKFHTELADRLCLPRMNRAPNDILDAVSQDKKRAESAEAEALGSLKRWQCTGSVQPPSVDHQLGSSLPHAFPIQYAYEDGRTCPLCAAEARVEALVEVLRSAPEPPNFDGLANLGVYPWTWAEHYREWHESSAAALADEPRKGGGE